MLSGLLVYIIGLVKSKFEHRAKERIGLEEILALQILEELKECKAEKELLIETLLNQQLLIEQELNNRNEL